MSNTAKPKTQERGPSDDPVVEATRGIYRILSGWDRRRRLTILASALTQLEHFDLAMPLLSELNRNYR